MQSESTRADEFADVSLDHHAAYNSLSQTAGYRSAFSHARQSSHEVRILCVEMCYLFESVNIYI